jgi:MscS family membrane protein
MTSRQNTRFSLWLLLSLALACIQVNAQDNSSQTADGPVIPADELNRGTPHRSAEGFLRASDEADYASAAEYLDLRNLRGEARELAGAELARRLDVIVKRAVWTDIDALTDDPAGRKNDALPDYRDSIGVVLDEGRKVRLLMQKVPGPNGGFIWKISNATVSLIPELYDTFGYPELIEGLRQQLPHISFMGFELFKWVIVLAVGMLVYGVVLLIALATRRTLRDRSTSSKQRIIRFLILPFGIWIVIISMNLAASSLGRGLTAEAWQRVSPIAILITVWVVFACIHLMRDMYSSYLNDKGRSGAVVLLNPIGNAIKLLVAMSAVLIYLSQLGINITTVLAGLGVGGIAVALALQKPMEDVFGAITLYTQQPVKVGDFCRVGSETGTIEEIGLRATRIRTLTNTLIAVPNSQLAREPIDNISAREKIRYRSTLRLRYDTTPEQLQQILEGVRNLLSSHERVLQDNPRVRFTEIADDALLVEVYLYLATTVWAEYLELAEGLNIQILEIVARAGTSLALPGRTLTIEQSPLPNREN